MQVFPLFMVDTDSMPSACNKAQTFPSLHLYLAVYSAMALVGYIHPKKVAGSSPKSNREGRILVEICMPTMPPDVLDA